jgi:hypothetical protein
MITELTFLDIAIAGQSLLNSLLEHDEDDTLHKRSVSLLSPQITGRQLIKSDSYHFSIREVWFFRGEYAISW